MSQSDTPDSGAESNAELAQRLARVEEQINHQSEVLDRIEQRVDEDHDQLESRVDKIQPQHAQVWMLYQGSKWALALSSGGGLLALAASAVAL